MPETIVQYQEQIGMQWLITMKKVTGLEVEYHFEKRMNNFTWAVDGLNL